MKNAKIPKALLTSLCAESVRSEKVIVALHLRNARLFRVAEKIQQLLLPNWMQKNVFGWTLTPSNRITEGLGLGT